MGIFCITQGAHQQQRGVGWGGVGGRLMREGIYVHLWLIHTVVWQKPTQHYKTTILTLKINFKQGFKKAHESF